MSSPAITQLDLVERQFNQVATFLAAGDAPHLQAAASMLQVLSVELAALLTAKGQSPLAHKALRHRVQSMAKGLQMLRDNLSRQASVNQQALGVVMPAPAKATYSGGSSVFGSVAQQAGVHRYLAA
jgi:hypothetical protein